MSEPLDLDALEAATREMGYAMSLPEQLALIERVRRAEALAEKRLTVAEAYRVHRDELDERVRRAEGALREIEEWPGLSIGICRLMKERAYRALGEQAP